MALTTEPVRQSLGEPPFHLQPRWAAESARPTTSLAPRPYGRHNRAPCTGRLSTGFIPFIQIGTIDTPPLSYTLLYTSEAICLIYESFPTTTSYPFFRIWPTVTITFFNGSRNLNTTLPLIPLWNQQCGALLPSTLQLCADAEVQDCGPSSQIVMADLSTM